MDDGLSMGAAGGMVSTGDDWSTIGRREGDQPARTYLAIDLKSFYASVECADRGLDPFTTDLVVADPERSANTICLAITPALKAKGVRNRCRVRDIPRGIEYLTAMPRMHRYLEVSCEVYRIYLCYVDARDAWPYSVDEAFLDATPYLELYGVDARTLAQRITARVRRETGIAATAGIGPNMFLCKVALDLMAKHADDGIGELDEETFRHEVWFHHPITDIWGIGPGIARRLARHGVYDLAGVCATDPAWLRGEFGKNAEWLIDHAWGLEPCTIADARSYVPQARSLSNGQVLMRDYGFAEARVVLREMAWQSCLDLRAKGLACGTVGLWVGYSGHDAPVSHGGGQHRLGHQTAEEREIVGTFLAIFDATVARDLAIRRVCLWLGDVVPQASAAPTLFDDLVLDADEARLADAVGRARRRFGPNAVLTGTSLRPGANARERNLQIGGHRA